MTKKSMMLGVLSLAIAGVAIYSTSVFAYRGDTNKTGPNYTPERHAQMEEAFENNDYNAWKNLMDGKGRVIEVVNEGNFNRFAEMHKLRAEGNLDGANEIRQELGLGQGGRGGAGDGDRQGQRGENRGGKFIDADGDGQCDNLK